MISAQLFTIIVFFIMFLKLQECIFTKYILALLLIFSNLDFGTKREIIVFHCKRI